MALTALTTIPDIVGTSHAVQITTSAVAARWVDFSAPAGNTHNVRYGDANVAAGRGSIIAAGKRVLLPPLPLDVRLAAINSFYQLASIYVYVQTGDTLSVTWGN